MLYPIELLAPAGASFILRRIADKRGTKRRPNAGRALLRRVVALRVSQLNEIFSPQQSHHSIQRRRPMLHRPMQIRPKRLDIHRDRKTLLRPRQIHQCRSNHTIQHRMRMIQRSRSPHQPMQQLLILMKRKKQRPIPQKNIDIAGKPCRSIIRSQMQIKIQVDPKLLQFLRLHHPRITLRSKNRRPSRIQRSQCMHQRRILLRLRKMVEVIRIFTQINKVWCRRVSRVRRPRHDKDRIFRRTLNRPFS
jgi:hypothetical protein